jgi:hypothetical protein
MDLGFNGRRIAVIPHLAVTRSTKLWTYPSGEPTETSKRCKVRSRKFLLPHPSCSGQALIGGASVAAPNNVDPGAKTLVAQKDKRKVTANGIAANAVLPELLEIQERLCVWIFEIFSGAQAFANPVLARARKGRCEDSAKAPTPRSTSKELDANLTS